MDHEPQRNREPSPSLSGSPAELCATRNAAVMAADLMGSAAGSADGARDSGCGGDGAVDAAGTSRTAP